MRKICNTGWFLGTFGNSWNIQSSAPPLLLPSKKQEKMSNLGDKSLIQNLSCEILDRQLFVSNMWSCLILIFSFLRKKLPRPVFKYFTNLYIGSFCLDVSDSLRILNVATIALYHRNHLVATNCNIMDTLLTEKLPLRKITWQGRWFGTFSWQELHASRLFPKWTSAPFHSVPDLEIFSSSLSSTSSLSSSSSS